MARFNYKDGIFILSGIFALSLYVLLLLLLALLFKISGARIDISINAPSAISAISVDLVEIPSIKSKEAKKDLTQDSNISRESSMKDSKDSGSKTALAGLGISDLFKKVDAKKSPTKSEELLDNRDKTALNKKGESQLNKIIEKTQSIMNALENIHNNISINDAQTSRFCEQYSNYCNELTALLYQNWHAKSAFLERLSSSVSISVSKDGNFSYTIKKKSGNEAFDSELAESLENLKSMKFPTIEGVEIDRLEVNFMNKGEE